MDIFNALAEPNRRNIIELLSDKGELSASDISEQFQISAPAVSQHLKVLREASLVRMEKRAQQRIYRINQDKLKEVKLWVKKLEKLWGKRFDALEELVTKS